MEPRKQKRLGPAPIASFEKSFEDNINPAATTTIVTAGAATRATQPQQQQQQQQQGEQQQQQQQQKEQKQQQHQHQKNVHVAFAVTTSATTCEPSSMPHQATIEAKTEMASHESNYRKQTTAGAGPITATTTTKNIETAPGSISSSSSSPTSSSTAAPAPAPAPAAAAATATNNNKNPGGASTAFTKQRPPPLKTATATVTTTLVRSSEGGQPLPPILGAGSGYSGTLGGAGSYRGTQTLTTPSTPRIELSRASSSSHHEEDESRESSPENVFDQVGTGTLQEAIGVGFREDGALELRSSTEELYFMDPEQKKEEQDKLMTLQQQQHQQQQQQQTQQTKRSSPHIFKYDDHQSYLQQHQRKDSASSEVAALLCISGRTSRISSVGSQGSAVSRLSAVSGVSRSPSPHRMLLETSFCGPKPLENAADSAGGSVGSVVSKINIITGGGRGAINRDGGGAAQPTPSSISTTDHAATAALLEQVLLARRHDPTQVVLAEGIKVETSPLRKPTKPTTLSNGETKLKTSSSTKPTTGGLTMGAQRRSTKSPGQMVVGKTPSGTEYIRINLKPDHMYTDKGIAPNERVVEAPNQLTPVYSKGSSSSHIPKPPASLSLQQNRGAIDENRLTPNASPKPSRHSFLSKDPARSSRSPSPAAVSVSRKSSFSSLFRLGGKDSPDSPRDRSRSRSKSKDRQAPQSQNVTPSKQKSVLAIFKPGKRGSSAGGDNKSSKSSSPIDGGFELQMTHPPPPPPQQQHHMQRSRTPVPSTTGSRPNSRLRYYDEPIEGVIHIPLHTPPEEKETRKLLQSIQQLTVAASEAPMVPAVAGANITASDLAAAAKALKPVGQRKASGAGTGFSTVPKGPTAPQRPQLFQNLDAIHTLPQDDDGKERTWSLEVQHHSSQDSQDTVNSESSYASAIKMSAARATQLANVKEHVGQENGMAGAAAAEIHRLPSVDSTLSTCEPRFVETVATVNVSSDADAAAVARERRRLLFATRIGSGSQEQIFSTQFSISKTESQSSQLSEQVQESLSEGTDGLQRQSTVIRRTDEELNDMGTSKRLSGLSEKRTKSISTSEDEPSQGKTINVTTTITTATNSNVILRRKDSTNDDHRLKSHSTSEEESIATTGDVNNQRHSRYLENFDVRKKYHENVPRKPKRQSISEVQGTSNEDVTTQTKGRPTLPQPPPPSTAPSPSPPMLNQQGQQSSTAGGHVSSRSPTPPKSRMLSRSQSQSPDEQRHRQTPTKPPRTTTPTRRGSGTGGAQAVEPSPTTPTKITTTTTTTPPTPLPYSTPLAMVTPQPLKKFTQLADRQSLHSTDEPIETSESERDSDLAGSSSATTAVALDPKRRHLPRHVGPIGEHESTGLVSEDESFDDELPYVPTTLPEERPQGVALIPMKERSNMELRTCPVDRPRSTTPLNPSHLEEYCGIVTPSEATGHELPTASTSAGSGSSIACVTSAARADKIRISLPRKDSTKDKSQSSKSPRRISNASGKTWFEFAEEGLRATNNLERKDSNKQLLPNSCPTVQASEDNSKTTGAITKVVVATKAQTTPTTSSSHSTQRKLSGHWIDFENIPEKRKPAKRITALPKETSTSSSTQGARSGQQPHQEQQQQQPHHHHHRHHHHQTPDVTASITTATTSTSTSAMSGTAGGIGGGGCSDSNKLHYNYVKPEDCQCECHEVERESSGAAGGGVVVCDPTCTNNATSIGTGSGSAGSKSVASVDLLQQSGEDMLPLIDPEILDGIEPSDSSREYSCYTDDEMDMPQRRSASSRSRSGSSKLDEFPRRDAPKSPQSKRKFPDNRK